MLRAIELAARGKGFTNPNPLVGAVIVKDGKIIAEGWHHKIGGLHAERDALRAAAEDGLDVRGGTIFVTLEPCCHQGRQPPCTDAIIASGIKKVFVGSRDPNSLVNGKGVAILRNAGIEVVQDFMKSECDKLNPIFFHYIKSKIPYVILKYAMTMDGETATSIGESKWITSESARKNVHRTRSNVMAVMTGIGTVLKDNPSLNVRLEGEFRQPTRVVLDSSLRIPLESNLVQTAKEIPLVIFCGKNLGQNVDSKKAELEKFGVKIEETESAKNGLSIFAVLKRLGEMGIDSVLVESGGRLSASLLFEEQNLVQEVHVYVAPKIFGNDGEKIHSPVRGLGVDFPSDAKIFSRPSVEFFGDDVLLRFSSESPKG